MKHRNILILLFLAIIASGLLTFANIGAICGATSGCVTVKNSTYAHIFGISTALIGLILISTLFLITLFNKNKLTNNLLKIGLTTAALGALFFIYLQIFAIGAVCKYCMVTDVSLILAAIIFFLPENK